MIIITYLVLIKKINSKNKNIKYNVKFDKNTLDNIFKCQGKTEIIFNNYKTNI